MLYNSNPKPNPDVFQRVVADVGQPPDLLTTMVATSTVQTAVISQKRENKRLAKVEVTKRRRQPVKHFAPDSEEESQNFLQTPT